MEFRREVGVKASDDMNFSCALPECLQCPVFDLLKIVGIGPGFIVSSGKGAERTPVYTNVCRVYMPVNIEKHPVAVLFPVNKGGHRPDFQKVPGTKQE